MWTAMTVSVPSRLFFCSLKTTLNLSPIELVPVILWFAGGLDGTALVFLGVPSALAAVITTPLVMVVDPFVPDLDAVQLLRTEPAVKTPASMFFIDAELVIEVFPLVFTTTGPVGPVS